MSMRIGKVICAALGAFLAASIAQAQTADSGVTDALQTMPRFYPKRRSLTKGAVAIARGWKRNRTAAEGVENAYWPGLRLRSLNALPLDLPQQRCRVEEILRGS